MYTIVLADDDEFVLDGFRRKIDWAELGIEIVGTATNGREALALVMELNPDILLTDIKMPILDGISLIQNLYQNNVKTKSIIISGYSEFEYAQKALQYKATDYLLKPTSKDMIEKVLKKIIRILDDENAETEFRQSVLEQSRANSEIISKYLIRSLLENKIDNLDLYQKKLSLMDNHAFDDLVVACIAEIDDFKALDRENSVSQNGSTLIDSIYAHVSESILNSNPHNTAFKYSDNQLAIVFFFKPELGEKRIDNDMLRLLCNIRNKVNRDLSLSLTIAYGPVVNGIIHGRESFSKACEAIRYKLFFGKNSIISYTKLVKFSSFDNEFYLEKEQKLIEALNDLKYEEAIAFIDDFYVRLGREKDCTYQYVMSVSFKIIMLAKKLSNRDDLFENEYALWGILAGLETLNDIRDLIKEALSQIIPQNGKERTKNHNSIIGFMINYVKANYDKNIYLNDISKEIYFSENYLTTLFRKEMGVTFKRYLIQYRMEKAKRLLKNPKRKIYEIAYLVGYENQGYFCNIFKEVTGQTPKEFRNHNAIEA